jgi:hypothetical protein
MVILLTDIKKDLDTLIKNTAKIPDEFWTRTSGGMYRVIWFIAGQKPSIESSYDFDEERFGLTQDGKIIWGYDSGCSCPSPWSAEDYGDKNYSVKEWKEFQLTAMPEFDPEWKDTAADNLRDYLKLIKSVNGKLPASEVFKIRNQEIRRFIMKRIGYDKIKKDVKAKILDTDGTSELLEITFAGIEPERYVKVTDSSTDREYLLYVPNDILRCKEGIAWTFGMREAEYNPIIET